MAQSRSSACDVAPRRPAEILALTETGNNLGEPVSALPPGEPADATTVVEINDAIRTMEACLNNGDWLRTYALYSDRWFQRPADAYQRASIEALATASPTPIPTGLRGIIVGPWQVRMLSDGRVMAAVLLSSEDELEPDPSRTQVFIFSKDHDRWLIDENLIVVRVPHCELPVPVAAVVGSPGSTELIGHSEINCNS